MSSSVYLTFAHPIAIEAWEAFCAENEVAYAYQVAGHSTYYRGGFGGVQITLDRNGTGHRDERGFLVGGSPPAAFERMTVGTFFQGDLEAVAHVALNILAAFPAAVDGDPEVMRLLTPELGTLQ